MKRETLKSLLHRFYPEWDESVLEVRKKLGFSFAFSDKERWDWFATGKHIEVREYAEQEMAALKLPAELAEYWVCCFYSNYQRPSGAKELTAVKGPPFLEIPCPSSFLGEDWTASIEKKRSEFMIKHGLESHEELIRWFWNLKVAGEVGAIGLDEVKKLDLPECYAMAWVCCFLPQGARWMADRAIPVLERCPQFAYWRQFTCTGQYQRAHVKAYPFVIDWSEGADEKYRESATMWDLQERGIDLGIQSDSHGNIRMTLSWPPGLVRLNELRQAVEYAQHYYQKRLRPKEQTPLRAIVEQFIHRAKVIPVDQRKESAQIRYKSGEATFDQLLCEEALSPEVQRRYKEYSSLYRKSPAHKSSALKNIRLLRKEVYDRVRSWVIDTGQLPKVPKHPPWWSDVLPIP